jgi:hypothetical protein
MKTSLMALPSSFLGQWFSCAYRKQVMFDLAPAFVPVFELELKPIPNGLVSTEVAEIPTACVY